ncbi:GNAT family N-acetyltransferase [Actinomyces vulturis]|uniref:GNAT family N-acetyltransferase n=1 Tax=Actinomyces vulturis TaxID=1857645 RepID=UPI0009F46D08|nr:GNAT family N-acetyltransferase [Actinomyces vulturis]
MTIVAAADGSALGNPGPAGWAWYVSDDCWAAGGWEKSTNNRGELTAVLELLITTAEEGLSDEPLHIQCDSQYVINSLTKWRFGWKKRGWKKADGKTVENVDLMKALDEAMAGRKVEFEWVRGHVGHPMNEAADDHARAAATAYQQGTDVPSGPGWSGQSNAATKKAASASSPEDTTSAKSVSSLSSDAAGDEFSVSKTLPSGSEPFESASSSDGGGRQAEVDRSGREQGKPIPDSKHGKDTDPAKSEAKPTEIRLVRMDSKGRDRAELIEFLTSSDFPFHLSVHPSVQEAEHWINDGRFDGPSAASFWIEERQAGRVGVITFEQMDHDWPLLAIRLSSSARGQGIGQAACRMATKLLFDTHPAIHRFEAQTRADNQAMRATLESLGWECEGECKKAWPTLNEDGTMQWSHNKAIYAILRKN